MASVGVNTSGSQFYICLDAAKHLDGRCMAFGRVVEGAEVLVTIEKVRQAKGLHSKSPISLAAQKNSRQDKLNLCV
jgi:cyclophilin family peptidyl-prolyl cis-trans isomerase